ncbi:hypothetical protein ACJIZ3_009483 [Penstemon smallii]|uniref:Pentatricopeptide repeat-containing protein n=1 Tax=Penstemon smallii TaxID=265156 RepID=A0ABD3TD56_9LAMI
MGLQFDPYIATSLIHMYVKCGAIFTALKLFDDLSQCEDLLKDVALWNSTIDGLIKSGFFEEGVVQFRRMQSLNVKPDGYTLCILLGVLSTPYGKEIHGFVVRNVFEDDPFVITAMVDMYSNSSRPFDAWNVFQKLENKSSIAVWNAMINCFCENGLWRNGVELYAVVKGQGLELGSTTFSSAFKACSQGEYIDFGCQIHCDVVKAGFENDPYISTSLLTFYSKCKFVRQAERIFYLAVDKKVEIWNSMISAYVSSGCANDALNVYQKMRIREVAPDSFTISNTLVACTMIGLCDLGSMIHAELIKRPIKDNVSSQSALLTMYSKFGNVNDAHKVFIEIKEKDVVAWGSMISANYENNKFDEALDLYKAMEIEGVKPDANIIASAIISCTGLGDGKFGCCIHGSAIKKGLDSDAFMGSSLIEFYSKCGQPKMANYAFLNVLNKNLVVWNSLISSYSQNGQPEVAISLLPQILQHGLYLNSITITTVLAAVSQIAALLKGKILHGYYTRLQIPKETQVENALIDMYIKCGCFSHAENMFLNMSEKNLVAWNSMIAGYGSHGECHKAIELFNEMINSGTAPDEITFLSLISSCNHCGFIDDGLKIFHSMKAHRIEPKIEHYINIVDLLGRAGRLYDAYDFVNNMTIAPNRGIWLSLLSSCRVHRSVELGELAADKLIEMDPSRGSNYVQLLNLYVEAGLQEKAANLRGSMRQKGLTKVPGCSWIEVKNKVDVFFSGDSSSPRTMSIYETLYSIRNNMKRNEFDHEAVETMYEPG